MIKNAIYFYFSPSKEVRKSQSISSRFFGTWSLVLLHWCTFFVIEFVIVTLLKGFNLLAEPGFKLIFNSDLSHNLVMFGLIGPILEEIINRQWLVYSRHNIGFPIIVLVSSMLHKTATHHYNVQFKENLVALCLSAAVGGVVYFTVYHFLKPFNIQLQQFWNKNQKTIVITSAIIFGYLHIGNYVITQNLILFSPIILGTYLIAGFLMGYLRVRYGFLYNCLFHITTNSAMLIVKFILIK